MDVFQVVNNLYAFPIGVVLIGALLVFTFGFRTAEQPAFHRLTTADDRKPAGKKRKLKDKKSQPNGHAAVVGSDDHSESRQKSIENVSKTSAGKLTSKPSKELKSDSDRSPTKSSIANKSVSKQQKQKTESSPVKENAHKSVVKEVTKSATNKSLKENKDAVDPDPKLLKEKKQQTTDKPVVKANNSTKIQQKPNKGKENKVEESKNKKNLGKLKKSEEKPLDFDDGEWEQAVSRKDKKNKKKDDEPLAEKIADKKENGSPSKKKKPKTDSLLIEESVVQESKAEKEDVKEPKSSKLKDKSTEEKSSAEKTVPLENDLEITIEKKTVEEANASPDQGAKSKKKKKKSSKTTEVDISDIKDEPLTGTESSLPATPVKSTPSSTKLETLNSKENIPEAKEVKQKSEPANIDTKLEQESPVVFDELGDVWKEAKIPKKSKKKVRKDQ